MVWSEEHRGFAVRTFFESGRSYITTQPAFRVHFNIPRNDPVPHRNVIASWVLALEETGSTQRPKGMGRQKTARTPENVAVVRAAVEQSPTRSARKHATALNMSDRSVRRILHKDLFFHPYKIMLVQKLMPPDFQHRVNCAQETLERIPPRSTFFSSDEAHFHLSGSVNKQNFRYWSDRNPQQVNERPLHSPKVTVWCAISKFGVIGPYFFEQDGLTTNVTAQRYVSMLQDFFEPELNPLVEEQHLEDIWFQQDGATAHTAHVSRTKLRQMFPARLVSLRGDLRWPARSPDLCICDFFLWGYLKDKVFSASSSQLGRTQDPY
ncbi:uncharacterized protein LOC124356010 [Homalodisca vitripennis]|uniref:uncharacterized protein LOC124356010 n=1 Tax=Homalodisca vitripennis TaxID=197043 RepID=UPI001EEA6FC0|nr:uncharacterized protein LOC124356010 [Homalodisca vitripennis]